MSAAYRWRAGSDSLGPVRNAVVAVTSASDRDRDICCALRLSGSLVETTSCAADACLITLQAPTPPPAHDASTRVIITMRSPVGVAAAGKRPRVRRRRAA